jgi:transcriptional regulator with XRE-family HTH domain
MQMTGTDGEQELPPMELGRAGPHLQRVVLGARLRKLREDQRIGRRQAADAIRGSESKISRLELGRIGYKVRDVEDLLTLYGVTAELERDPLLELAQQASQASWWQPYRDIVPGWIEPFLSLEQDASVIRVYESSRIPDLLQTPDYAHAIIRQSHPDATADEIDQRVRLRLRRQQLLSSRKPVPPQLWAVIDEAALHRPAGSPAIMRSQLRHLADLASQPHIRIFVVPFSAGQAGSAGFPFTILRFPGLLISDFVCIEHRTGAVYPDTPDEIRAYWHLMNGMATEALPPAGAIQLIEQVLDAH